MSRITVLRDGANELVVDHFSDSFDQCKIFKTSGTTGVPKEIRHTRENLIRNATAFNSVASICVNTVMYHCFPLRYMAGYLNTLVSPLLAGGRVVIGPQFTPLNFWEIPLSQGCNTIWLSPTMAGILAMLNRDENIAAKVKRQFTNVFCGTGSLRPHTRRIWLETFGVPLRNSYGTSEQLILTLQSQQDAETLKCDCGEPIPGVKIETINGELHVSSGHVDCHQVPTKDAGEIIDGRVTVYGRLDDMIIRGGENIDPIEIENVILGIPSVIDVAVVGLPHEVWGESVAAFVQTDGDLSLVVNRCREQLPAEKRPAEIICIKELPRTANGKIKKEELRSMAVGTKVQM